MPAISSTDAAAWQDWEAALERAGLPVPLTSRHAFITTLSAGGWLIVGPAGEGVRRSGCAAVVSRSIAGHRILRIDRFGPTIVSGDEARMATEAAALMSDTGNLRLDVRVFDADPQRRARLAAALAASGFEPAPGGDYRRTLRIDLDRPLDEVLASFSSSARRNVRSLERTPLEVRQLDIAHADRLAVLDNVTIRRTGGVAAERNWGAMLMYAEAHPQLLHAAGAFATVDGGASELIAFAFTRLHGDHAEYADAASARVPDARIKPGHVLVWDAVAWGHERGAGWFDMGGVTAGTAADPADPLGGISDFKRSFTRDEIEIAEEWVMHSSTMRARLLHRARDALRR